MTASSWEFRERPGRRRNAHGRAGLLGRSPPPCARVHRGGWGLHDARNADRQHLLAAGADHVEKTVFDTQRTLTLVALPLRRPAPESISPPALEVVAWTGPTTAPALARAHGA